MTKDMWLGVIRHILTIIGSGFAAKGYIDASSVDTIVGASMTIGAVVWSVVDKKGR